MDTYKKLLLGNKAWAKDRTQAQPDYFKNMSEGQKPDYLWIGCSDSRVPANEVTGTDPGEMFVHRNIANLVVHTDMNMLSVLQYAVEVLKVKHVIVCGHYGCGGVQAAQTHNSYGLINKWLRNIKDVYRLNEGELNFISDPEKRTNRLVELNVLEQVGNLAKTTIVQRSWKRMQGPTIHGWVFDLKTGLLNEITRLDHTYELPDLYRYDFSQGEILL
jgi:carbonic anhydrase